MRRRASPDLTTRTVTAASFGGPDQLTINEVDTPAPGRGEVAVSVRAIGVNPIDWKLYAGYLGQDPTPLTTFGSEVAGVVTAVGDGVSGWGVGDVVIAPQVPGGAYASDVVVPADGLLAKPEGLDTSLELVPDPARVVSIAAFAPGDSGMTLVAGQEEGAAEVRRPTGTARPGTPGASSSSCREAGGRSAAPGGGAAVVSTRRQPPQHAPNHELAWNRPARQSVGSGISAGTRLRQQQPEDVAAT